MNFVKSRCIRKRFLFNNILGFKKDYPSLNPSTTPPQEYLDKLREYLKDFFTEAIKAPDSDGIMVAKDTVVEMLCKVC